MYEGCGFLRKNRLLNVYVTGVKIFSVLVDISFVYLLLILFFIFFLFFLDNYPHANRSVLADFSKIASFFVNNLVIKIKY